MKWKIFKAIWLTSLLTLIACTLAVALIVSNGAVWLDILNVKTVWTLLLLALVFTGLAALIAARVSGRITDNIDSIDLDFPLNGGHYAELQPLKARLERHNERSRTQAVQLRQSRDELRLITGNMREGLVIVDDGGQVLMRNTSAQKLLGEDMMDLIGETVENVVAGRHCENTLRTENGVYSIIGSPVFNGKTLGGAVIIMLDITEKEQREALRREFTSNVSHELKTPLTSIYGISEMLIHEIIKPEDVNGFVKRIHDESGRMITLIDDILRLSQLDENSGPIENEPVELFSMVRDIAGRLESQARERNINIAVRGEPATIQGAPAIVDEMIANLVDNAIKYNKENGRVVITVFGGANPGFTVKDTGIGIPQKHIERVFERFYRVDKSHSKSIGGTGLGLSIVKHAAAYHNATIRMDSSESDGTTVTVQF